MFNVFISCSIFERLLKINGLKIDMENCKIRFDKCDKEIRLKGCVIIKYSEIKSLSPKKGPEVSTFRNKEKV